MHPSQLKMEGNNNNNNDHIKNGFLRADQIDLKSLDEQLQRHLTSSASTARRGRSFDKSTNFNLNISGISFNNSSSHHPKPHDAHHNHHLDGGTSITRLRIDTNVNRQRQDWEIDPSKLVIKSVIARGSFGTVHRGFYDGLDVAGVCINSFLISNYI
ncbi:hypothetical protein Hdeb2414_s0209g00833141 [Helianthus debilis subsp. tardiflorus]